MAPLDQYLMERNAEIALARSAAPESIYHVMPKSWSSDGTAIKLPSKARTVSCVSWNDRGMAPFDHPEFWNPKMRGPLCFNPPAVRSILPLTFKRTELVVAGLGQNQDITPPQIIIYKKEPIPSAWRWHCR